MNPMNLDDILASLEKTAGEFPFKKEEDEKKSPEAKKEEAANGKDGEGKEKKEEGKKDEKKEEQEKSAAEIAGADLAKQVMEKVASKTQQSNKGEEMNKQAQEAGIALAQALLKQANVGDVSTSNGVVPGTAPNKTIQDLAAQKAEHDMIIQPTPGTDGAGNGGTVNQIFDAIVADAMARGSKDEKMTGGVAPVEGAQVPAQTPNQRPNGGDMGGEATEKAAAVSQLVADGASFEDAVAMVKQAEEALVAEHDAQVKQAAFNELIAKGASFEDAVALIKSAAATPAKDLSLQKQAAVNALIEANVSFEDAIALVNAKSQELYGA